MRVSQKYYIQHFKYYAFHAYKNTLYILHKSMAFYYICLAAILS